MKKLITKKGFTLMEMLIVVAIIAILVAIAVPVFSSQLTKAKTQVDEANLRTAISLAVAEYMLNDTTGGEVTYYFTESDDSMNITTTASGSLEGKVDSAKRIKVTIDDGAVVTGATKTGWFTP